MREMSVTQGSVIRAHSVEVTHNHRLEIIPVLRDTVNDFAHTGKTFVVERVSLRWDEDDLPNQVNVTGKVLRRDGGESGRSGRSTYYLRQPSYTARKPAPEWLVEIVREASIVYEEQEA